MSSVDIIHKLTAKIRLVFGVAYEIRTKDFF